jgi:HEAT repeat protein/ATP/ADP translocase
VKIEVAPASSVLPSRFAPPRPWWSHILSIPEGLEKQAGRLLALVFLISFSLVFLKAAQSGIFLGCYNRDAIPWVFATSAVSLATCSLFSVALAPRWGHLKLTINTLLAGAAAMVGLRLALVAQHRAIPFLLYVVIESLSGLLIIQVWSVVSGSLDPRSAKRILPIAGLGSSLAWTVGGVLVTPACRWLGAGSLLLIAAALLGVASWLVAQIARQDYSDKKVVATKNISLLRGWQQGLSFVHKIPLMRLAVVLSVLALITEELMDYQLLSAANDRWHRASEISSFFGMFYAITSVCSLVFQTGFTSRLLVKMGASRTLAVTPILTTLVAFPSLLLGSLMPVVVMRGTARVLKQSLWGTSVEQTQTPLPVVKRTQARALIRGVLAPSGYALTALCLAAIPAKVDLRWLSGAIIVISCTMAILVLVNVRGAYQKALHQAIDQRSLDFEKAASPRAGAVDADTMRVMEMELASSDEMRAGLAAEMLSGMGTPQAANILLKALHHPAGTVRSLVVTGILSGQDPERIQALSEHLLHDPDGEVRLRAAQGIRMVASGYPQSVQALQHGSEDALPKVRAECLVALLELEFPDGPERGRALVPMLADDDLWKRQAGLSALTLGCLTHPEVRNRLRELLCSEDLESQKAALTAVSRLRLAEFLPEIAGLLEEPRTATLAAMELAAWGDEALVILARTSRVPPSPDQDCSDLQRPEWVQRAYPLLLNLLSHRDRKVREGAARVITYLVGYDPDEASENTGVELLLKREIRSIYRRYAIIAGLARDDGTPDWEVDGPYVFLKREIEIEIEELRGRVIQLLYLLEDPKLIQVVEVGLRHPSPELGAKIAELLELSLDSSLASRLVPLFDRLSLRERIMAAEELGELDQSALRDPLKALLSLNDNHLRACAMLVYQERFANRYPEIYQRESHLLALFERMRFLRSVPMFGGLPGEDLRSVAEIVEQIEFESGEVIFRKGDPGEHLFLIISGSIQVRDGQVVVATLGEREVFGELAVLDREPRSADAVCEEDVQLLRLSGADFEELIARRPNIQKEIVLVLTRRLRDVTRRVIQ